MNNISISIHQPIFLPWIRLIHKISISDYFVFIDNVKFSKNDFQNRNYINTNNGKTMLTVPVKKTKKNINDLEIFYNNWTEKHLKTLYYSYKNSPNFEEIFENIRGIYSERFMNLADLNISLINYIVNYLKIETPLLRSSEMDVEEGKTDRLVSICNLLKATEYIVGKDSKYIEKDKFSINHINIIKQEFIHPKYSQLHSNKCKDISILDWMFQGNRNDLVEFFREEKKSFDEKYSQFGAYV